MDDYASDSDLEDEVDECSIGCDVVAVKGEPVEDDSTMKEVDCGIPEVNEIAEAVAAEMTLDEMESEYALLLETKAEKSDCTGMSAQTEISPGPQDVADKQLVDSSSRFEGGDDDSLMIQGGAFRTWQAMILYLYTDHVAFAPLRSRRFRRVPNSFEDTESWPCSPKSMYRLADKLQLDKLKQAAQDAIKADLTEYNIVEELFSDFTWRHLDILRMETEIYLRHCTTPNVKLSMSEILRKIEKGNVPHSATILNSLILKLSNEAVAHPVVDTSPSFPDA